MLQRRIYCGVDTEAMAERGLYIVTQSHFVFDVTMKIAIYTVAAFVGTGSAFAPQGALVRCKSVDRIGGKRVCAPFVLIPPFGVMTACGASKTGL